MVFCVGILWGAGSMVSAKTKIAITTGIDNFIAFSRYVAARMIELFGFLCGGVSMVLAMIKIAITTGIAKCIASRSLRCREDD